MNAAVFYGPNDMQIKAVDIKKENDKDILLKVLSCSVCSYDVRTFRKGHFKVIPPIVLGHEICAQLIDEYSSHDAHLKPQSRVSVYPIIPCFNCWFCGHKKYNLCTNLKEIGSTINGGFAEYISIPKSIFKIGGIVPVMDNVTDEEASLIEPLACCINGINQIKHFEFDSVIIIGDGPIGLMQLMLIKKLFNKHVTVVGKVPHRLESAKKMGADIVISADDIYNNDNKSIVKEQVIKYNEGRYSPNLVFISNNNPSSLNLALQLVNKNGYIVIFSGIKNPQQQRQPQQQQPVNYDENIMNIDPNFIHYNQVSIIGSFSSNPKDLSDAMNIINSGEIDLKSLVSQKFSLFKIKDAFIAAERYTGFKSIINTFY